MIRDARHVPVARGGAYPLRPANAVRPLIDGEPAFRRICHAGWVSMRWNRCCGPRHG